MYTYTKDQLVNVFNYPVALSSHYAQIANLEDWTEDEVIFVAKLLRKAIAAIGEDFTWLAFGHIRAIYDGKGGERTAFILDPAHGVDPDTKPEIAAARRFFAELRESGEEAKLNEIPGMQLLPPTYEERRLAAAAARRRPLKD